jgi:hypothetical protein
MSKNKYIIGDSEIQKGISNGDFKNDEDNKSCFSII